MQIFVWTEPQHCHLCSRREVCRPHIRRHGHPSFWHDTPKYSSIWSGLLPCNLLENPTTQKGSTKWLCLAFPGFESFLSAEGLELLTMTPLLYRDFIARGWKCQATLSFMQPKICVSICHCVPFCMGGYRQVHSACSELLKDCLPGQDAMARAAPQSCSAVHCVGRPLIPGVPGM